MTEENRKSCLLEMRKDELNSFEGNTGAVHIV